MYANSILSLTCSGFTSFGFLSRSDGGGSDGAGSDGNPMAPAPLAPAPMAAARLASGARNRHDTKTRNRHHTKTECDCDCECGCESQGAPEMEHYDTTKRTSTTRSNTEPDHKSPDRCRNPLIMTIAQIEGTSG